MTRRIVVMHFTPPGIVGGVEQIMKCHGAVLSRAGYEVRFVAGRSAAGGESIHVIPQLDAARPENVSLEAALASGAVPPSFHYARRAVLDALVPLLDGADALIVHNALTLHFSLSATAALWEIAGKRLVPNVIAWTHDLAWVNPLYLPAMHSGYPWDLLRLPAPATRYVTVSRERAVELRQLWGNVPGAASVVPNGIDPADFLRLSARIRDVVDRYRILEADIVLLLPVRVTRRKNIQLGLRVVHALKARGLAVRFLISGPQAPHHPTRSQTYLGELLSLRDELDLRDDVAFLSNDLGDSLTETEVAELFAVSDCLFFPSESEGFGIPILEAGLAGLPTVLSDIPVFREVGGSNASYFSLSEPPGVIAGTIERILDTSPARQRRRIRQQYSWSGIADRYLIPMVSVEPAVGQVRPGEARA